MGLEIENPQQFLGEAKIAVAAYQKVSESLKTQREQEKQLSAALDKARKEMQDKIQKTLKARGDEITATYDKQLRQVDARLKKAQDEAEKKEAALLAEFESERSSWTDKEAMLTSGFHEIEDIVDGEFLAFFLRAADCRSGRLLIFSFASFCYLFQLFNSL